MGNKWNGSSPIRIDSPLCNLHMASPSSPSGPRRHVLLTSFLVGGTSGSLSPPNLVRFFLGLTGVVSDNQDFIRFWMALECLRCNEGSLEPFFEVPYVVHCFAFDFGQRGHPTVTVFFFLSAVQDAIFAWEHCK